MKRPLLPPLALAALAVLAPGCASKTAQAPQKSEKTDYVLVNAPGSWIPRKVSKKTDIIGDRSEYTSDQKFLERAVSFGNARVRADPEQGRK